MSQVHSSIRTSCIFWKSCSIDEFGDILGGRHGAQLHVKNTCNTGKSAEMSCLAARASKSQMTWLHIAPFVKTAPNVVI